MGGTPLFISYKGFLKEVGDFKKLFFFFFLGVLGSNSISLEGFVYNVLISPQRKIPSKKFWELVSSSSSVTNSIYFRQVWVID